MLPKEYFHDLKNSWTRRKDQPEKISKTTNLSDIVSIVYIWHIETHDMLIVWCFIFGACWNLGKCSACATQWALNKGSFSSDNRCSIFNIWSQRHDLPPRLAQMMSTLSGGAKINLEHEWNHRGLQVPLHLSPFSRYMLMLDWDLFELFRRL